MFRTPQRPLVERCADTRTYTPCRVLVLTLILIIVMFKFFVWAIKRGGIEDFTAHVLEYMDNKDDALDSAASALGLWQITLGTTQVCVARRTSLCV